MKVNSPLWSLGFLLHRILRVVDDNFESNWLFLTIVFFIKNIVLIESIYWTVRHREKINYRSVKENFVPIPSNTPERNMISVLKFSVLEAIAYRWICSNLVQDIIVYSYQESYYAFPFFVIHSFCLEVVFDLFHYCTHRFLHSYKEAYKFHKQVIYIRLKKS